MSSIPSLLTVSDYFIFLSIKKVAKIARRASVAESAVPASLGVDLSIPRAGPGSGRAGETPDV
jgi:hypothetical protein